MVAFYIVSQTGGQSFHSSADEFSSDAKLRTSVDCG